MLPRRLAASTLHFTSHVWGRGLMQCIHSEGDLYLSKLCWLHKNVIASYVVCKFELWNIYQTYWQHIKSKSLTCGPPCLLHIQILCSFTWNQPEQMFILEHHTGTGVSVREHEVISAYETCMRNDLYEQLKNLLCLFLSFCLCSFLICLLFHLPPSLTHIHTGLFKPCASVTSM